MDARHDLSADVERRAGRAWRRLLTGSGPIPRVAALLLAVLLLSPASDSTTSMQLPGGSPGVTNGRATPASPDASASPTALAVAAALGDLDDASAAVRERLEGQPADSRDAVRDALASYVDAVDGATRAVAAVSVSGREREAVNLVVGALEEQRRTLEVAVQALVDPDDPAYEAAIHGLGLATNALARARQELTSALGP